MRTKIKPYQGHIIPKSQPTFTMSTTHRINMNQQLYIDITVWLFNIAIENPL